LPLRTRRGIRVQLEGRGKGRTAICRTDVINVARITASAVLGIDQVNDVVESSGLTPAFVPPVTATIAKHAGKVTHGCHAGAGECRAAVRVSPRVTAVS
jgi:hypothetical protein